MKNSKQRRAFVVLLCGLAISSAVFALVGCGTAKPNISEVSPITDTVGTTTETVASSSGEAAGSVGLAPDPADGVKLTINSGENKKFLIPIGGMNPYGFEFSWTVDWGDGTTETLAATSGAGKAFDHEYPNANTTYVITILPDSDSPVGEGDDPGWFQAFGFSGGESGPGTVENRAKLQYVDGILDDKAINAANQYVCYRMFMGCDNLKFGPNFRFDIAKTESGGMFAAEMFRDCSGSGFEMNDVFVLPQFSQESVNMNSFWDMFQGVTSGKLRPAADIIGKTMLGYGDAAPAEPIGTFSEAFDLSGIDNANWYTKGSGA